MPVRHLVLLARKYMKNAKTETTATLILKLKVQSWVRSKQTKKLMVLEKFVPFLPKTSLISLSEGYVRLIKCQILEQERLVRRKNIVILARNEHFITNRNFKADHINQKWFIDVNFIRLENNEHLAVCVVIDSYANQIVG